MNDNLPNMHDEANNALVRLLSNRLSAMRGGAGQVGASVKEPTGSALEPANTPRIIESGRNINSPES